MKQTKVIISPHMDDAALSMGGNILRNDAKCKMITLFASNWTLAGIDDNPAKITNIRLSEEQKIVEKFNAEFVFGNFPEATMRGYNDWGMKCNLQKDAKLLGKIINLINTNIDAEDEIYLPAAIGEHVDHVLVFETIPSLKSKNIKIYEDLPYATYGGTFERINKISHLYKTTEKLINITDTIDKKLECLKLYQSQLTKNDIIKIKNYAKSIKKDGAFYERLWVIDVE